MKHQNDNFFISLLLGKERKDEHSFIVIQWRVLLRSQTGIVDSGVVSVSVRQHGNRGALAKLI